MGIKVVLPIVFSIILLGALGSFQDAEAGFNGNGENGNGEPTTIWCEVFGEWDSGQGFWKFRGDNEFSAFSEGDAECLITLDSEEIVADVEIHGEFLVGDFIESENEGQCK